MGKSKIEWTEQVWNPVTGCTPVSEGCENCYARRLAEGRLRGRYGYDKYNPFEVTIHWHRISEPYSWRKPRRVFVCSMGDLFHESIITDDIHSLFRTMLFCSKHIFMILTKRPERMKNLLMDSSWRVGENVWLGVSVENQKRADERIPILLQISAAVRFVSVEPMLEPIDFTSYLSELNWTICGGESGPVRRLFNLDWARDLRDQCKEAEVPFFMKQVDKVQPIPDDLMIREYPKV